jgi:hypothetical protein
VLDLFGLMEKNYTTFSCEIELVPMKFLHHKVGLLREEDVFIEYGLSFLLQKTAKSTTAKADVDKAYTVEGHLR